ncbi:MAG: hypothetical protein A3J46_04410 [Candidatus Yanofskybacteria bacterium RIFCSPHIGHO2_02_FULL_41_11]|uniref:Type II secretion system protein GspI C-terminal domain-containing protein n=1 Tax=Candidatus Yanofskybacteria bacterium RIFCSPHIGHO2_02_FULL_41_11 TaxID=1802675 RepID=A0A1F8F6L8_9BACT|nr:MAG: hypothetical protein A3J46_04410 [Candidatus Yanofskybacteria bacterium RIFCSPHIGHO2_02_FULL_41_11]
MEYKNKLESGTTIIEVLMALVLLTLGLIPIFAIMTASTTLSSNIRDNLIAANLAQEGIEVVRAIRDTSWLNEELYNQDLPNGDYRVSWDSDSLMPYDANAFLKKDANKIHSYASGSDTIFKRRINISSVASSCSCELKVISEVTWLEKNVNRVVTVEDHLFNWK